MPTIKFSKFIVLFEISILKKTKIKSIEYNTIPMHKSTHPHNGSPRDHLVKLTKPYTIKHEVGQHCGNIVTLQLNLKIHRECQDNE